jgi:preprotein translocase subunit SecE
VTRATSKKAGSKKASSKTSKKPKGGRRQENALVRYFRQTWAELKKVHWPTRREATNLSLIVLGTTVFMSAFLGVVDWLSAQFFSLLVRLTH